jgi:hypothetical protein
VIRVIRPIVAAALVGLGAASCGAPRSSLGTEASICFRELPAASAAAPQSRLVGVRRITADHARDALGDGDISAAPKAELCVFAFRPVDTSTSAATGQRFTIVVIDDHRATAIRHTDRLPLRFHHLS